MRFVVVLIYPEAWRRGRRSSQLFAQARKLQMDQDNQCHARPHRRSQVMQQVLPVLAERRRPQ